jgi:hypothetical protein
MPARRHWPSVGRIADELIMVEGRVFSSWTTTWCREAVLASIGQTAKGRVERPRPAKSINSRVRGWCLVPPSVGGVAPSSEACGVLGAEGCGEAETERVGCCARSQIETPTPKGTTCVDGQLLRREGHQNAE